MAYKKLKVVSCLSDGCPREGSYAVFSNRNHHMGDYCLPHADEAVARLKREEQGNGEKEEA